MRIDISREVLERGRSSFFCSIHGHRGGHTLRGRGRRGKEWTESTRCCCTYFLLKKLKLCISRVNRRECQILPSPPLTHTHTHTPLPMCGLHGLLSLSLSADSPFLCPPQSDSSQAKFATFLTYLSY